jgi:signal transduction histidine kinase
MYNRHEMKTKILPSGEKNEPAAMKNKQPFPPGLWIWYTVEDQHLWSESLYRITGIDSRTRPSFNLWLELVLDDDLLMFLDTVNTLLCCSKPRSFAFRIVGKDKVVKKIQCFAEALTTGSPEIYDIAFLCSEANGQDIYPRQSGPVAAKKEPDIFRERLLSVIAHDLKNSFNSVIGFSNLLLTNMQRYNRQRITQYIGNIHSSANIAGSLLEKLLQWAALQGNRWNLVFEETDINGLTAEVIEQIKPAADYKQIQITGKLQENIKIYTDAEAVKIILRNLLSNAIKYSYHNGEVLVTVNTSPFDVRFSVADYGMGLSPGDVRQILNSPVNISQTGTDNEKGTGIGISICKELAKLLGGNFWVKSKKGKGSEFGFNLPKKKTNTGN